MIGGIIITHGEFAQGIKDAVEMIAGQQEKLIAISLRVGDGLEQLIRCIQEELIALDCEECVLFVDLFGATPCNAASVVCSLTGSTVIAGVNLPILLEFVTKRETCNREVLVDNLKQCSNEDFRMIQQNDLF